MPSARLMLTGTSEPFNYRGITEWVDWLDNRRLLEPIGNIWPAESETRYYAMLDEQKRAA